MTSAQPTRTSPAPVPDRGTMTRPAMTLAADNPPYHPHQPAPPATGWPGMSDEWACNGTFVATSSGRIWPLLSATATDVHWPDIARQLARIPRFGACTDAGIYSVAQHSVAVMRLVSPAARAHALLHDAHEAYIGDMITPVKRALRIAAMYTAQTLNFHAHHGETILDAALERIRQTADAAIHTRAGIAMPWQAPLAVQQAVHAADRTQLAREAQWLLPAGPALDAWAVTDPALFRTDRGPQIEVLHADLAEQQFLHALAETIPAAALDMESGG